MLTTTLRNSLLTVAFSLVFLQRDRTLAQDVFAVDAVGLVQLSTSLGKPKQNWSSSVTSASGWKIEAEAEVVHAAQEPLGSGLPDKVSGILEQEAEKAAEVAAEAHKAVQELTKVKGAMEKAALAEWQAQLAKRLDRHMAALRTLQDLRVRTEVKAAATQGQAKAEQELLVQQRDFAREQNRLLAAGNQELEAVLSLARGPIAEVAAMESARRSKEAVSNATRQYVGAMGQRAGEALRNINISVAHVNAVLEKNRQRLKDAMAAGVAL